MQNKNFFVLILLIFALAIAACEQVIQDGIRKEITNFDECAKAGYPIGESYPKQCFAPDGTFVEEIGAKEIITDNGYLLLKYDNGKAILSGTLDRSTPCVNWTVQIGGTKDLPRSEVTINIFDSNKEAICIQVLGEPQEIYEEIEQVSQETSYTLKLEQEIVFEGKLSKKGQTSTVSIEPEDPSKIGLSSYPDLPLDLVPSTPIAVRYLIEHRSALNEKVVTVNGIIVASWLDESKCPQNVGLLCPQPRIFLADTNNEDRNPYYDLDVKVGEEDKISELKKDYPIGNRITIKVLVYGYKTGVSAIKID